jgi:hypothetical protein
MTSERIFFAPRDDTGIIAFVLVLLMFDIWFCGWYAIEGYLENHC